TGGPSGGAIQMGSGSVTNNAGATISGDTGILAFSNLTVVNAGTIRSTVGEAIVVIGSNLTLVNSGSVIGSSSGFNFAVDSGSNSNIVNNVSGMIVGSAGILVSNGSNTIFNAGVITGLNG